MRKFLTFLVALAAVTLASVYGALPFGYGFQGGCGGYNSGGGFSGGCPPVTLPLDGITTGIKAAYSTRQLLTAYAGKSMNVTRASDSTSVDIGFVANVFDTTSLNTFCSGTTCSVTIWYDQSGNGYNLIPGTAAPTIYASGAFTAINSKPAVSFNPASPQALIDTSLPTAPVNTLYQNAVVYLPSVTAEQSITAPSATQDLQFEINAGHVELQNASVVAIATSSNSMATGVASVVEAQYNESTGAYSLWIDRSSGGTGTNAQALTPHSLVLGAYYSVGMYAALSGNIGEYIAYDLVGGIPSGSQTSIENNQKAYWGTP